MTYNFDTTATSPVLPEVLNRYVASLTSENLNPSSPHKGGLDAARAVDSARRVIARCFDADEDHIIFTSGGTESTNHALKGAAYANRRIPKRLVITAGEHDATRQTALFLKRESGYDVVEAPLTLEGKTDLEALRKILGEKPCGLISFIAISNETGAVNDIGNVVRIARSAAPNALIHADIVQLAGKMPFSFRNSGLDFASVSGHKFGAPKGVGLLLARRKASLAPLIDGGGQQDGRRSGTENPPAAVAIAEALRLQTEAMDAHLRHVSALKKLFLDEIADTGIPFCTLSPEDASPYVLAAAFPGLRGETMLHALSADDILIGTGSACGSRHQGKNHVLEAMGCDRGLILSACRISFSASLTPEDVRYLVERAAANYRRYAQGGNIG